MMKQLKERIIRMLKAGSITDENERQKLEYLLKAKKWNPYCIRHSAITYDSDFLPEYALKKKAALLFIELFYILRMGFLIFKDFTHSLFCLFN
jgi:hypothetical protein